MTSSPDDQTFKLTARHDAIRWKATTGTLPAEARVPGSYRNYDALPFCLPRNFHELNLLPEAREVALQRFREAGIPWHDGFEAGPSNHLLDSQLQCANALAPFVRNPAALAAIFGKVLPIDEVLPFSADGGAAHLSSFDTTDSVVFEWQGLENHLNEWVGTPTRGSKATSADAAIRYRSTDGSIELALIEWKYTESYPTGDLGNVVHLHGNPPFPLPATLRSAGRPYSQRPDPPRGSPGRAGLPIDAAVVVGAQHRDTPRAGSGPGPPRVRGSERQPGALGIARDAGLRYSRWRASSRRGMDVAAPPSRPFRPPRQRVLAR